jgi:nuclear pore complex protein Nup205
MYNFSNSEPKAGGAFAQKNSGSDTSAAAIKARPYNASSRPSNFTPHTGAKKLVVKNLRAGPRLNQDAYFEKVWSQLEAALVAIFDNRKPDASLEELYKGAENVCRQGRAAVLAKKLQEKCKEHISGKLREGLLSRSADGDNVEILRSVVAAWNTWNSTLV